MPCVSAVVSATSPHLRVILRSPRRSMALDIPSLRGIWGVVLLSLLCMLVAHGTLVASAQSPQDSATEVRRISSKLQCPICEGTSIADSRSAIAQDMRKVIADKLATGESEEAILQYFVDRYGPGILRDPPVTGF